MIREGGVRDVEVRGQQRHLGVSAAQFAYHNALEKEQNEGVEQRYGLLRCRWRRASLDGEPPNGGQFDATREDVELERVARLRLDEHAKRRVEASPVLLRAEQRLREKIPQAVVNKAKDLERRNRRGRQLLDGRLRRRARRPGQDLFLRRFLLPEHLLVLVHTSPSFACSTPTATVFGSPRTPLARKRTRSDTGSRERASRCRAIDPVKERSHPVERWVEHAACALPSPVRTSSARPSSPASP